MKIAIVGCGAVGSFYGAKLCRAGLPVFFLLRSDYEVVRQEGVRIISPDGEFRAFPCPARQPAEIGVCDLVIIALKATANHAFPSLLPRWSVPNPGFLPSKTAWAMKRLWPPSSAPTMSWAASASSASTASRPALSAILPTARSSWANTVKPPPTAPGPWLSASFEPESIAT